VDGMIVFLVVLALAALVAGIVETRRADRKFR
jgi:hypothetical protein